MAIIEHSDVTSGTACSVSDPLVSIGAVAGDENYEFFNVGGAALLSGGDIAVTNRGTEEVRIYDRRGQFVRKFGGRGEGPGEFRFIGKIWAAANDTLIVMAYHPVRLSIFTPAGEFVRQISTAPPYHSAAHSGVLSDGTFFFGVRCCGLGPQRLILVRHAADGTRLTAIDTLAYSELEEVGSPRARLAARPLFQPLPTLAARGEAVALSQAGEPSVAIMDPEGRVQRIMRWKNVRDDTPQSEHVDLYRDERLEQARSAFDSNSVSTVSGPTRKVADQFPVVSAIVLGKGGEIWVSIYRRPGEALNRWLRFDATGRFLCRFDLPAGEMVLDAVGDSVLVERTDDYGVEYVELRSVIPDGDGRRLH